MGDQDVYTGSFSTTTVIVTITTCLALYNALELLLLIFTTFSVYRGLYFWSLIVATTGLVPYSVGLILQYFRVTKEVVGLAINNYGWWTMVTGQSVVLYSRLGVVLGKGNERILRYVKWMIIIDALLFHTTTTVVEFGSYYAAPPAEQPFSHGYNYVEKIQMTGFCIQEFIISALYLWKTIDIVKTQAHPLADRTGSTTSSEQRKKTRVRRIMLQLFVINIVIVAMDIALLVIEYKNLHVPEVAFKGLCYSVKLKLEFAVLSKLVEVAGLKRAPVGFHNLFDDSNDLVQSGSQPPAMNDLDLTIAPSQSQGHNQSHRHSTAKMMLSYGSQNSTPPEWLEDLEKIRTGPTAATTAVVAPQKSYTLEDGEKMPSEPYLSNKNNSTFNSISVSEPPVHRRIRRDSDLLYADAIRQMSRTT
jgi:hypothetical protein